MASIVDVALGEEGVHEQGTNNVPYNTWYYGHEVQGKDYPWCAAFVSWCANEAGVLDNLGGKTAAVSTFLEYFQDNGRFQPKGNGYIPQPGDIMIQKDAGASHTGIVVSYNEKDGTFTTIEGNQGDKVTQCTYKLNDKKLTGFGVPGYNTNQAATAGRAPTKNTNRVNVGDELNTPTQSPKIISVPKKHSEKVEISHPTIEVQFYTEEGMLATVSTEGVRYDTGVQNDIISCNIVRNMGQDCPTMTLTLVWRKDWFNILSSNDLIIVKMCRPPEEKRCVFYGLIDDIRKTIDFSSGQPQRAVQVTCRGFAKAFVNFDVGLISSISEMVGTGFFGDFMNIVGVDSWNAIKIVLDSYVGTAVSYEFTNGKSFKDYFVYDGNHYVPEKLKDFESYISYNGSLWNFIKEISNLPFNETFWEIINDKPTMIHRRTPFNPDDWVNLECDVISDYDIVSNNTGRSDLETYTVYTVIMTFLDEMLSQTNSENHPMWYPKFYPKYGISQLIVNTNYTNEG